MKAWFVSDIHITGPADSRLTVFEGFLRARLTDQTTHLFLVGDIFDLWVGGASFFAERYSGVVSLIRDLRAKGVRVVYFEGNHDLHLERIWSAQLGCEVATEPKYYQLGRWLVRVEHGDLMNPDDTGYHFLRSVLRTPFVKWLANALPGRVIQWIGNLMSRSSRKWTSSALKARRDSFIRTMIHSHAERALRRDGYFDLMVSGHVHVEDDYRWEMHSPESLITEEYDDDDTRFVRSVNLGWWLPGETPRAFRLEEEGGVWVDV